MLSLILFIAIGVGISNIVVNAELLEQPKKKIANKIPFLGKTLSCMMCTGFGVGMALAFVSIMFGIPYILPLFPIFGGAIISVSAMTFQKIIDLLDSLSSFFDTYVLTNEQDEVDE